MEIEEVQDGDAQLDEVRTRRPRRDERVPSQRDASAGRRQADRQPDNGIEACCIGDWWRK